ncbi:MAG TPA: cupin domain-containing protein [Blastocatellia bacterium]|nr:cupin domain-containing protein [Blastocatellia bacterium]
MLAYRLDQQQSPIDLHELSAHGIFYRHLPEAESDRRKEIETIKAERGYVAEDVVELTPNTPDLDIICAKFDKEHIHTADEVRFVLDGSGIFDIRDLNDQWIRVVVEKGDLIIVPKDRNHRFMLTESKHIQCLRLFQDTNGWSPIYRTLQATAS